VPPTVRQSLTAHQAAEPRLPAEDPQETNRKSGIAYAAAFSLFAAVVSGLGLGWLLDRWLGTKPWLMVVGIVLGAVAGFYELVRASSKLS
jgi:ATP synthase protein I